MESDAEVRMTIDRTQPPSDEIMGKVVAKWKGWDDAFYEENDYPDQDAFVQDPEWYLNEEYKGTYPGQPDPRECTDAVLELLHHIGIPLDPNMADRHWWTPVNLTTTEVGEAEYRSREYIPISGQPFRTAVCWLAAEVLGVTDAN
ncbi:MAG: hypothetical protein ACX94C_07770 [Phycisphaerales bacterium]